VGRLVTYRVSEDFDHFAAVLCNYNVRAYQNQVVFEHLVFSTEAKVKLALPFWEQQAIFGALKGV
jgi:hypothetical protein